MSGCGDLTFVRSEGIQLTYTVPSSFDLTGYTGEIRFAAFEGDTVLLTVAAVVTASSIAFTSPPPISEIPDADPVSDPWIGVFETDITSPTGFVQRIHHGAAIIEKGV